MTFDDDVRDLYQEVILDHGRRPRHTGRLAVFDATAKGDNPLCGDRVQIWVKYAPDGSIAETSFEARGCAISVASADLQPALERLAPLAGVHEYPSRVKCATLPWHTLSAALEGRGEASSEGGLP